MPPGRQGPSPRGYPRPPGPAQQATPCCSRPGRAVRAGTSTCDCSPPVSRGGLLRLTPLLLSSLRWPPSTRPSCPPWLQRCLPRWLAPSSADLPSRRLVLTRFPACSRWPWRSAVPLPIAVLAGALSLCGQAGGTAVGGAGQGGRSCRQTWCRVSSLCRRATRAALFSSVALHSSNAHWFRSAACPAAQVAATLPSSGSVPARCPIRAV